MKQILNIFLVVLLSASCLIIFAQVPNTPPPPQKLIDLGSSNPMDNFSTKGLPDTFFVGKNRSDSLAAWLAKEISGYDKTSLSVLMGTLQKLGFFIIDQNQKILYSPTTTYDMEMSFYDFEVVGMLKTSGMGKTTTIKKLAEVISQNNPKISADKLAKAILDDLKKAKNSEDMRLRFAANFIFELSKNLPTPVDLTTATPENAKINIIQLSIIERILLGDLIDSYSKTVASDLNKKRLFQSNEVRFISTAFWSRKTSLCDSWDDLTNLQNTSRKGYENAEKNPVFVQVLDECEMLGDKKKIDECKANKNAHQEYLQIVAQGLKNATISSASDQLEAASQTVKIELQVQDPMPLIRTKSSTNLGETRDLTAKLTMEIVDKEKANQVACMQKLASSNGGSNFDLFQPTTLDGKTVSWAIVSGSGSAKLSTQADKLSGMSGESKISLVGKPQKEDLTNRKVYATPETVEVMVSVYDNKAGLVSRTVSVPLRDWIPCSDDWGGTIKYKRSDVRIRNSTLIMLDETANIRLNPRKPEEINIKPPNAGIYVVLDYYELSQSTETNTCCPTGNILSKVITKKEQYAQKSYSKDFFINYIGGERDFSLGFVSGLKFYKAFEKNSRETTKTDCPLGDDKDDDTLPKSPSGIPNITDEDLAPVMKQTSPTEDDLAPLAKSVERQIFLDLEPGRYGQRFVGTAGELLFGSKKLVLKDGSNVTWEWNLSRCKD